MTAERIILDNKQIDIVINRLCQEILENHRDFKRSILVGIQPRGTLFCNRILNRLSVILQSNNLRSAALDISFFRDDFRRRNELIQPQTTDIPSIEGKNVILVDDVLYTGRSVRAAIDALMNFGRPKNVEYLCLIDRRFSRELPIQADYIGKSIDSIDSEKVIVSWKEKDSSDSVIMINPEKNE